MSETRTHSQVVLHELRTMRLLSQRDHASRRCGGYVTTYVSDGGPFTFTTRPFNKLLGRRTYYNKDARARGRGQRHVRKISSFTGLAYMTTTRESAEQEIPQFYGEKAWRFYRQRKGESKGLKDCGRPMRVGRSLAAERKSLASGKCCLRTWIIGFRKGPIGSRKISNFAQIWKSQ